MHGSIYSGAVDVARDAATALGHRLSKFAVIRSAAYTACETCGSRVTVLFHAPIVTLGNAVELPCKNGEANVAPPDRPQPATGKAKHVAPPRPTLLDDDVPWPTDAPVRDAAVLR